MNQYVLGVYALPERSGDPAAVTGFGQLYAKTDGELYFENEAGTVTKVSEFKTADRTKLDGIATGATANSADAVLLSRANHTGTQTASTISDFPTAVAAVADVAANTAARHTHTNQAILDNVTAAFTSADETKLDGIEAGAEVNNISDLNATDLTDGGDTTLHTHDDRYYTETEIDTALSGKSDTGHTHTLSDVTDAGTAAALDVASTGDAGIGEVVKGNDSRLTDSRTPTAHTHTASEVTDFDTEVGNNTTVAANTAARHTHANQTVLDNTTASFTSADETKLDGIESGATANSSDATLLDRSNHTGTQPHTTITGLGTAATYNVPAAGDANTLQVVKGDDTRLTNSRTPTAHTHTASEVTDFDTEVSNNTDVAANTSARHSHSNKATLDLITAAFTTADETKLDGIESGAEVNNISDVNATDLTDGGETTLHIHDGRYYTESEIDQKFIDVDNDLAGKANTNHTHVIDDISDVDFGQSGGLLGLGLGASAPQTILHIGAATPILRISDTDSGTATAAAPYIQLYHGANTTPLGYLGFTSTGDDNMEIRNFRNGDLELWTNGSLAARHLAGGGFVMNLTSGSTVTIPAGNNQVAFEFTNNTTFTIKARGSDGTVRSGTVALS